MSRTIAVCAAAVASVVVSGCGSSAHFADRNRPPTPVNLSVYVNDSRVSVSPAQVGAGPIVFLVTNSASNTESVTIQPSAGSSQASASTGPINPGTTAQVQVDLAQGDYTIATSAAAGSDAAQATVKPIQPATLLIGPERPNANNAVLQP